MSGCISLRGSKMSPYPRKYPTARLPTFLEIGYEGCIIDRIETELGLADAATLAERVDRENQVGVEWGRITGHERKISDFSEIGNRKLRK